MRSNCMFRPLSACLLSLLSSGFIVSTSSAQQESAKPAPNKSATTPQSKSARARRSPGARSAAATRNPQISRLVLEIDPRNIESTIRRLVSFGTRNTLSEQNNPNRGIGAARDWLYGEFMKAAQRSGGRMTVEKQTFEQPKAARVPQPAMLTNIVATLKGTQPESSNRVYVVSGHYDSMC